VGNTNSTQHKKISLKHLTLKDLQNNNEYVSILTLECQYVGKYAVPSRAEGVKISILRAHLLKYPRKRHVAPIKKHLNLNASVSESEGGKNGSKLVFEA
jgi:hypothetical protein